MVEVTVLFEGTITVTLAAPYDAEAVRQEIQNRVGHTGVIVEEVLIADGAHDL